MSTTPAQQPIIVGVDGSSQAAVALAWAIDEARAHGAALTVIHGFAVPRTEVDTVDHSRYPDLAEAAQKELDAVMAAAPSTEGIQVTPAIEAGQPAHVLVQASREASLLVVGTRGRGGFEGLVLGSVSSQCVHHAHCPVVVVRSS
jgi:nucleotide-binding universal stress UspA family protein